MIQIPANLSSNLSVPKFIAFEGGEGVGKTTAIQNFCEILTQCNISHIRTREPGGSAVGEKLREIFLNPNNHLNADSELLMIFSARADHLDKVILPALADGKWVICDRFLDSTVAYQGFGRWGDNPAELDKMLIKINDLSKIYLTKKPDLRLWLDLDWQVGRDRAKKRSEFDRIEQESPEFYERVYQGFVHQYAHNDGTMRRIDASVSTKEVLEQIVRSVSGA